MATMILGAAGSALGGALGGSMAGLTTLALGKAAGATLGSMIDKRLLGLGAEPVETGRVNRFRVMGAGEGAPLPRVFGRMRVSGQIIWSSRFLEHVDSQTVGGKGGGQQTQQYSYSVSLAIALCEGEIARVGRIWADGEPVSQLGLNRRLHLGGEDQIPDPLIAAIEGEENAPAYRGTAYLVIENLDLSPYGNRIPQFNFEVFRRPKRDLPDVPRHPALDVRGVALVPGTGEYSLATAPVYFERGKGQTDVANVHNDEGVADLVASLGHLRAELPNTKSVSLVVSWFGDDLRCDRCALRPAVEQKQADAKMPWRVSSVGRSDAKVVNYLDDRPVFGGTPTDASVIQALRHMKEQTLSVMFYPFILMDILANNGLRDPWTGNADQAVVPWRGRITLSHAPGQAESTDKTAASAQEVEAFFGRAKGSDFHSSGDTVDYTGPQEWSYRRFILHYAHLCKIAGGVDAFCIGSEMRGLTQVRDGADTFPTVRALIRLASDIRGILGPETKVGYAADWSEYFGYHPADGSGDVFYHLDPLWANQAIDFVGIDNYMPLSDWRDGEHKDLGAGSIYDLRYLTGNVAGGEGYEWYYADADGRAKQDRRPIKDGAYGEDWIFRYKDIASWWSKPHHDRPSGQKNSESTQWRPGSKPIWFTELGCPAIDKGTNQPNVFYDPKSSESFFPYFSNGNRDDFIQHRYLQATYAHWGNPDNNPVSEIYGEPMIDLSRAHVWAWDARPWPDFPSRIDTWTDGSNYARGHWLNGRASLCGLDSIVAETCRNASFTEYEVGALHGGVTGYSIGNTETARQSLQPLMLAYGFDGAEAEGELGFANRGGKGIAVFRLDDLVDDGDQPKISLSRSDPGEAIGRVLLGYIGADSDYQAGVAEALFPDASSGAKSETELGIVLGGDAAQATSNRWLSEARVSGENTDFMLPMSKLYLTVGDLTKLEIEGQSDLFRIDRIEDAMTRKISATKIETEVYESEILRRTDQRSSHILGETPAYAEFLDLPLLTGDEVDHAPYVAVTKRPWRGPIAVYSSNNDYGYMLNTKVMRPATMGTTTTPLARADAGLWMQGWLGLRISGGTLQSRTPDEVLAGANAAALRSGDQGDWEVFQFQSANLVGPREYVLRGFLRGQAGTDGIMPDMWPAGTSFVLLEGAVEQISLPATAQDLKRHYRIGSINRPYDDPSYLHQILAFANVGLRPYRPAHLIATRARTTDVEIGWIRRARLHGDSWAGVDVPLDEPSERYIVRIFDQSKVLRETIVDSTHLNYRKQDQLNDGAAFPLRIEVAQVSDRFGAGPFARIEFNG